MKDSGDIAVIGIPFAAGVAAGAMLAGKIIPIPIALPMILGPALAISAILAFFLVDDLRGTVPVRIIFASLFFAAGLFCSINSAVTSGIFIKGPQATIAEKGGHMIKNVIDNIPYPNGNTGPLVKALITGDRSGLGKDVIGIFRSSGASHILALSGLHLGIIYLLVSKMLSPLGNSTRALKIRYFLIILLAGAYALATGASPSIVRAFLFIAIGETARLTGRTHIPSRVLLAALTIQLAVNPGVISSAGFQLSYLAMTGIALIYPPLERLYPAAKGPLGRIDPIKKIWDSAVLSISCQAFTAPLAWALFHTFPKYFLITNLIALPLTSAVVVLSVATTALYPTGMCPEVLINLNDQAAGLLVRCLEIISSM